MGCTYQFSSWKTDDLVKSKQKTRVLRTRTIRLCIVASEVWLLVWVR